MVLATNNGLPIDSRDQVVLFGAGSKSTYAVGKGSGAVYNKGTKVSISPVNIIQGIENKLKQNNNKFKYVKNEIGYEVGINGINKKKLTESDIKNYAQKASGVKRSVAILTISKFQGENTDRVHDRNSYGTMLTNSEKQTYDILKQYFDHIVLVLNVGSMIQLNNIEKDQKTSILISYYPGMEAGNAIVDVLVGDVNPSAHLTSTWAKTINDYPTTSTFIENINYVKYKEGLFVGYRYFEEDENTQSKVVFPFGHGLSYTTFKLENNCTFDKDKKLFIVNSIVKNTGKVKGKQVVQVYAKKPQNENFVKVKRELVAFGKTKDIEGGQSETLTMTFDLNYLSSYDDLNVTGHKACYILEKGDYEIYVGDSIAATRDNKNLVFTYSHNETTVLECFTNKLTPNDKDVENANIKPNFDDLFTENDFDSYNQNQEKGRLRLLSTIDENMNIFNDENKKIINLQEEINEINFKSVLENKYTMKQLVEAMTDEELAFLSYGKNGHIFMADGAFGGNYKEDMTGKYNIPYVDIDDGPAGLRQADEKMQSTAFPAASALASSFDLEMMEKIGEIIGKEACMACSSN